MKSLRLLVTAVVAAAIPLSADAQMFFCSRPSAPYIPIGSYSDRWSMERAERDVDDYLDQMNNYLDCLAQESQDAQYEAERVIDEWNRAVNAYNRTR